MIVLDASVALSGLLSDGQGRQALKDQQLHVPHLTDSEVASGLRRRVAAGQIKADDAWAALRVWQRLGVTRYPVVSLLHRVWELRDNVTAYDACYIALAEFLGCALMTADARLGRAPGIRCAITIMTN